MAAFPEDEWQRRSTEVLPPTSSLTSSVPKGEGYLVHLGGEDVGRRVPIAGMLTMGRDEDAGLQLRASDVSRHHARITQLAGGEFFLEDLASRNGTLVNGEPIHMHILHFGDTIHLGARTGFLFTHHNPVETQQLAAERVDGVMQLAGGMAHHINNLLAVMLSNLAFLQELAADTSLRDALVVESLTDMRAAVARTSDIIRQLLSYARSGRGRTELVDLSTILVKVVTRLRQRVEGARVEAEVEAGILFPGDALQLQTMFENLADNAVDATQGEGGVTVGARVREIPIDEALARRLPGVGRHVEIWVCDDGEGMDAATRDHAFEPFFSTKGPTRGTGLGLAAVYGVVKAHGGFTRVDSEIGRGTTIWVYLPLEGASSSTETGAEAEGELSSARAEEGSSSPGAPTLLAAVSPALAGRLTRAAATRGRSVAFAADARDLVMTVLERRLDTDWAVIEASLVDASTRDALKLLRRSARQLRISVLVNDGHEVDQLSDGSAEISGAEEGERIQIADAETDDALAALLFASGDDVDAP